MHLHKFIILVKNLTDKNSELKKKLESYCHWFIHKIYNLKSMILTFNLSRNPNKLKLHMFLNINKVLKFIPNQLNRNKIKNNIYYYCHPELTLINVKNSRTTLY